MVIPALSTTVVAAVVAVLGAVVTVVQVGSSARTPSSLREWSRVALRSGEVREHRVLVLSPKEEDESLV